VTGIRPPNLASYTFLCLSESLARSGFLKKSLTST
jgi:hypothetical protein